MGRTRTLWRLCAGRFARVSLAVLAVVSLTGMEATGAPRVLLIGLDAADWDYLDPLIASGHVPTLGGLVASGVKADYDCSLTSPSIACYCPPVWMSIFTGWPSAVHGVETFSVPFSGRGVPAIWNVLRYVDPGRTVALASAHTHTPAAPEATWIITMMGALGVADQLFDLWSNNPLPDWGDPSGWASPSTLFQQLGQLPHSGATPTVWFPFGGDRVSMEGLNLLLGAYGTPAFTAFIFHSLDRTTHLTCDQVMSSPDGPVDEQALLALADAWTGPVGGTSVGDAASQYLEADQRVSELLALGSWDYVMIASDHGMVPDPGSMPCHHTMPQAFAGVFALSGPGVKAGVELPTQDPLCAAPLLAYLLDLPVSLELPCVTSGSFGSMLTDVFTAEHLQANLPTFVSQWQLPAVSKIPSLSRCGRILLVMALLAFPVARAVRRAAKG